jgi:hypothetical protein
VASPRFWVAAAKRLRMRSKNPYTSPHLTVVFVPMGFLGYLHDPTNAIGWA